MSGAYLTQLHHKHISRCVMLPKQFSFYVTVWTLKSKAQNTKKEFIWCVLESQICQVCMVIKLKVSESIFSFSSIPPYCCSSFKQFSWFYVHSVTLLMCVPTNVKCMFFTALLSVCTLLSCVRYVHSACFCVLLKPMHACTCALICLSPVRCALSALSGRFTDSQETSGEISHQPVQCAVQVNHWRFWNP